MEKVQFEMGFEETEMRGLLGDCEESGCHTAWQGAVSLRSGECKEVIGALTGSLPFLTCAG